MTVDTTLARIRAFRMFRGWSTRTMAKEAGISEGALRHMDSDEWGPTTATLRQLEAIIPDEWVPP